MLPMLPNRRSRCLTAALLVALCSPNATALSLDRISVSRARPSPAAADAKSVKAPSVDGAFRAVAVASALAVTMFLPAGAAFADEYGRETEAPTLFTGETVMICKKRGPLGACLETVTRTPENDNDKASKYFPDPAPIVKAKYDAMTKEEDNTEGSALIKKLRQQTEDNKEKNAQIVRTKTMMNDQSANFGPFDRQVVILNADGETFSLLQNAQAMRLKEAGYIKDRRFVTQPTKEVIEEALVGPDYGEKIRGFFGGGD